MSAEDALVGVIVKALSIELKLPEESIRAAASLKTDCRLDSIAAANVAFAIEEELGVEIEILKDDSFDTVGEIVALVARSGLGRNR